MRAIALRVLDSLRKRRRCFTQRSQDFSEAWLVYRLTGAGKVCAWRCVMSAIDPSKHMSTSRSSATVAGRVQSQSIFHYITT